MAHTPEQPDPDLPFRFYTLLQVAAMLATTQAQVYAMVRTGDLPAIKIGGRGQWRVAHDDLARWIDEQQELTRQFVAATPMYPAATSTDDA